MNSQTNGIAFQFALGNIPEASAYTAIYDQYRLVGVKIRLTPRITGVVPFGAATGQPNPVSTAAPAFAYAWFDPDDSTAPTNILEAQQRTNSFRFNIYKPHKWFIRPKFTVGAFSSTGNGVYVNRGRQWLDCGTPNVYHYGWKMMTSQVTTAAAEYQTYDYELTYYLNFKIGR